MPKILRYATDNLRVKRLVLGHNTAEGIRYCRRDAKILFAFPPVYPLHDERIRPFFAPQAKTKRERLRRIFLNLGEDLKRIRIPTATRGRQKLYGVGSCRQIQVARNPGIIRPFGRQDAVSEHGKQSCAETIPVKVGKFLR